MRKNIFKNYSTPSRYASLGADQKRAFEMLVYGLTRGINFMLTGNAGTGKSFLFDVFAEFCKLNGVSLIKAAPTGIAASHIGGMTLHKLFKLDIGVQKPYVNTYQMNNIRRVIGWADAILIDEISMVRSDMLANVANQITIANKCRSNYGLPPIQVIVTGDFGQLAPVISENDNTAYKEMTGHEFENDGRCFDTEAWQSFGFRTIKLREQMRQSGDGAFAKALDNIRIGINDDIKMILEKSSPVPIENAVWVCGYKNTVAKLNADGLRSVPGRIIAFNAEIEGNCTAKSAGLPEKLEVKVGARVMTTFNDPKGSYVNGSMGTIVDVIRNGYGDKIVIRFDGRDHDTDVTRYEIESFEYVKDTRTGQLVKQVKGKIKQFPVQLAYAITAHKAQGQSYDKMNMRPEIFSAGQLYVMLSRCTSLENVHIGKHLFKRLTGNELMNVQSVYDFLAAQEKSAADFEREFEKLMNA